MTTYFKTKLENRFGNRKKTLKTILHRGNSTQPPTEMIIDNESINDPFDIANHLNSYLTDIGPKLSDQIFSPLEDNMPYLGTRQIDDFILAPTCEQEVLTIIQEL